MNFQSILIVTYGRSGSTLLQGILNSIEGTTIRGENNNFVYGLYLAYKSLAKTKSECHDGLNSTHPWFGAELLDPELFAQQCRPIIEQQLKTSGSEVFGFKEIRYEGIGENNIIPYLEFLRKILPNPMFVFNTRDHNKVCKSAWWKSHSKKALIEKFIITEKAFDKFRVLFPECTHLQTHEDTTGKRDQLKLLFNKLNAHYDEDVISGIIGIPHSYKPKL